ncbi:MAG TPA: glycosyltransferase family 2 protein [Terriglobales bacterium]|nr:glycosyltransferase family 2 protein [Terriglobales bacterium]
MQTVAVNIVRYNHRLAELQECIRSVLAQEMESFTVTVTENGSGDTIKDELFTLFGDAPRFRYEDNGANLGFSGAQNRFILHAEADIVVPLNPDTIMTPGYLQALTSVFADARVGAATGKMLRPPESKDGSPILDGTGIVMSRGRRGRERGQSQPDTGQFDNSRRVFGVSGTASAYRKSALDHVRIGEHEYFDEDFFAYWEDLDLSWRLRLAGYECVYVPEAVIYHSRLARQSKHGYRRPVEFIRHHKKLPGRIVRLNWKNQLFCIIKSDFGWSFWRDCPFIICRQIFMLAYIVVFEPRTLGAAADLIRGFPKMLQKRRVIRGMRNVNSKEIGQWFLQT